jgi:hypothetical protein
VCTGFKLVQEKRLILPYEKVTVNEFCPALVTGVTACVDCILVG